MKQYMDAIVKAEAGELRAAMERMGNFLDGYRQK